MFDTELKHTPNLQYLSSSGKEAEINLLFHQTFCWNTESLLGLVEGVTLRKECNVGDTFSLCGKTFSVFAQLINIPVAEFNGTKVVWVCTGVFKGSSPYLLIVDLEGTTASGTDIKGKPKLLLVLLNTQDSPTSNDGWGALGAIPLKNSVSKLWEKVGKTVVQITAAPGVALLLLHADLFDLNLHP